MLSAVPEPGNRPALPHDVVKGAQSGATRTRRQGGRCSCFAVCMLMPILCSCTVFKAAAGLLLDVQPAAEPDAPTLFALSCTPSGAGAANHLATNLLTKSTVHCP